MFRGKKINWSVKKKNALLSSFGIVKHNIDFSNGMK